MTSPTPPSDSSSLLVPIHVDALSVNSASQQSFSISPPDYNALSAFKSPLPFPFATESPHQKEALQGIHLHWALPDALTHGRETGDDRQVEFPFAPNRWLVVRFEASGAKWDCQKVTVVRSDYIGAADETDPGTTPFLDPTKETTPSEVQATNIGKSYDITEWEAATDPNTGKLFLQAVGPGNATFAAYQPYMQDVFAFTDPASKLPTSGSNLYAYLVVGWYSDPSQGDPLWGVDHWQSWMTRTWAAQSDWKAQTPKERFETLLGDLEWSVLTTAPDAPPSTSIFHGYIYDVVWPGPEVATGNAPNVPDPNKVRVAVGNTSVDALAALIQQDPADEPDKATRDALAQLLEAAQYNLLDEYGRPGGSARLEQKIRQAWFGDRPGGTVWKMVGAAPESSGEDATAVSLTPAQQVALDLALGKLNSDQRAFDEAARKLASLQSELYRYWWKNGIADTTTGGVFGTHYDPDLLWPTGTTPQFAQKTPRDQQKLEWDYSPHFGLEHYFQETLYPDLQQQVWKQYCDTRTLAAKVPASTDPATIEKWADTYIELPNPKGGKLTPSQLGLVLKPGNAPRFHSPNDPVVLFAGLTRSRKHGEDGRYNKDGTLTCRLPGETITGVTVGSTKVDASKLTGIDLDPLKSYTQIPVVSSLLVEAFFADFNNASVIHGVISTLSQASITKAMKGPDDTWPNPNLVGTSPVPFALIDWEQAWAPLFLEWSVDYYPTGSGTNLDHKFGIGDWAFDGEEYGWNGTGFSAQYMTSYTARTFVTPHAALVFKAKIEKYLKNHPAIDSTALDTLLDTVAGWDILSQSLSGLTDQLITLMDTETFPPPKPTADPVCPASGTTPDIGALIGENYHSLPILLNNQTALNDPEKGTSNFYPVRGGFLVIQSLKLIDTFGQAVETVHPNTPSGFVPVRGEGLVPSSKSSGVANFPDGAIQLPPRAVQPARLDFRFLSADGSGSDVLTAGDPNAVCGWLLPNHLDRGIAVYDNSGQLLGEVLPLGSGNHNWRPRPGPSVPVGTTQEALSGSGVTSIVLAEPYAAQPMGEGERLAVHAPTGGDSAVVKASAPVRRGDQTISIVSQNFTTALPAGSAVSFAPPPAAPAHIDNQVLRAVVVSIAGQTEDVFDDFLRVADETLWMVDPLGGRKDQMLSVLIGRPLAVVQAKLDLVLDGIPARNQFWQRMAEGTNVSPDNSEIAKQPWKQVIDIGEIEEVTFPVQLGNLQLRDDGLIGYYLEGGADPYGAFYALHYPSDPMSGDHYIHQIGARRGNFVDLSFQGDSQTVTMIMDPRGVVHAASGILPTESAALPASAIEDFLETLRITFRTGPLIADPGTLRVPKPAEDHGTWNWLQRVGTGSGDSAWEADPIVDATGDARLPDGQLELREGWLQFVEAEDPKEPAK